MRGQDEVAGWIALRKVAGVGDVAGQRLAACFGDAVGVLSASRAALVECGVGGDVADAIRAASLADAADEIARIAAAGARIILCGDPEYPAVLRQLVDAPLYLVARGERLPDGPAIAVVGARHATPYGKAVAARLAEELALAGVAVVSGLARGIDGAAHRGALRGGGPTVAVLGSGIDVIYPREHAGLADEITANGTLLSELPVGAVPHPEHFPKRNRIIAGMTHGTLVVEAADKSGSQITARLAMDQGREVYAVPGRIDSPLSVGAHRLIQQGARLVGDVDDILSEIAPALRARGAGLNRAASAEGAGSTELEEGEPLLPLLTAGPLAADELIRQSGLPAAQVLTRVLELELRGMLVQLPGKQFQLASR